MRVSMKYNAIPTACEAFSYGQVEDYTVNIVSSGKRETASDLASVKLYPNPATSILNVTSVSEKATFRITSLLGQEVSKGNLASETIDVSSLASGNYILEIRDNDTATIKRFIKNKLRIVLNIRSPIGGLYF